MPQFINPVGHLIKYNCGVFIEFSYSPFLSGINIFLDGYVPTENLRFRETSLVFKVSETAEEEEIKRVAHYKYPAMSKTLG